MLLITALGIALMAEPNGELVCRYDPDRAGSQIVLRSDGSIRFVSEEVADKDAVMKADIFRHTNTNLYYRMVMVGRTDTFEVSLKTHRGTQRLSHSDGTAEKVFRLVCE